MTTIREAIDGFADGWVAAQAVTPRHAYERTLRVLAFRLPQAGVDLEASLDVLRADDLAAFVSWHAGSGLADDADGTRKTAVHIARLGDHLAATYDRPDLAVGRDALRALAG